MRKNITMLGCGLLMAAGTWAQTPVNSGIAGAKGADSKFAMEAAEGGMAEVQLGQLAADRAQSQQVKDFGARMVKDHTRLGDELKGIMTQEGKTMPTSLNSKDQALYNKLSGLSGADFDRTYIAAMVRDHRSDISAFKTEANSGQDAQLKAFASNALPTLEEHLKMARQAASTIGAKSE